MDMTSATEEASGATYLGFDFGTSTSSLCYVNAQDIRVYADRAADRTWMGLSALIDVLPYPVAYPLARFVSETTSDQMDRWGREALEGMLAFAAYTAFAEHCILGGAGGALFKGFRQRSAGPLWSLFKLCASATGSKWIFARDLLLLVSDLNLTEIDHAVSQIAQTKHGKRADSLDYPRVLEKFGNALAKTMHGKVFGYFEDARRKKFSMQTFQGIFRNARGSSPPFIDVFEYEGPEDFPQEFIFIIDLQQGIGLPLFPIMVRGIDKGRSHHEEPDFFLYDIVRQEGREVAFKSVQERAEISLNGEVHSELLNSIVEIIKEDPRLMPITNIKLGKRNII